MSSPGRVALVRLPEDRLAEGLVTHLERRAVDVTLARAQHDAYVEALQGAGWSVRTVAGAPEHPDSVFVEDTVVVVDDLAVLTRPGAPSRRGEVAGTAEAVAALGLRTVRVDGDATLDGGDVLQVGPTIYVGRGGRTNAAGVAALRAAVAGLGRTVVPVPLLQVLHLKSAVTALPDGTLIGWPSLVDVRGLPSLRVPPEEPGAHVVVLDAERGAVLLAASAPRTGAWLADLGFAVTLVDVSEFEKLEGCVTCLSVLVP